MAKPFSTISLVDRLAASSNRVLLNNQREVEQGSVTIVFPKAIKQGDSPIISNLLSSRSPTSNVVVDQPYYQTFVSRIELPDTKSTFRKVISLENRLNQSALGTTNHLPQFFLSDTFTGYIVIKPFGVQEHTSNIDIFPFTFEPSRDGVAPVAPRLKVNAGLGLVDVFGGGKVSPVDIQNPTIDILSRQGVLLVNGVYTNSFINVTLPVENIILRQGVVMEQSQFNSIIDVDIPLQSVLELQGVINNAGNIQSIINTQQPSTPESIERGGVEPTNPQSIQAVAVLQGLAQAGISIISINPVIQNTDPLELHGSANLATTNTQQNTPILSTLNIQEPQPFTFQPQTQAPILQTLGYSLDRLLAVTSPRVKHGSASLLPPKFGNPEQNHTLALKTDYTKRPLGSPQGAAQIISDEQSWLTMPDWMYDDKGKLEKPPSNGRVVEPTKQPDAYVNNAPTVGTRVISSWLSTPGASQINAYRALSYSQIVEIGKPGAPRPAISPAITNTNFVGVSDVNNDTDFIDLIIEGIRFRAYITAFSENYSVSWNDISYMGRPDTLKAYKGTTRSISLSFKTAAFTKSDLTAMYQKIQRLINASALGTPQGSYLQGPLTNLTVGKWLVNTPCVVNSIKLDTNPTEFSWDVGSTRSRNGTEAPSANGLDEDSADSKQMPMIVDISMDFSVLGNNTGGQMLAGGNYISLLA